MRKQKQNAKIVVTNYVDLEDYARQYQKLYNQERARHRQEIAPPRPRSTKEEKQEAHRERARQFYAKMRENLEWRKETNRKTAERRKAHPRPHYRTQERVYKQVSRLKQRIAVLAHYGVGGKPVCRHCGFDDVRALSIDHVHNNGSEHRKTVRGGEFYTWLGRNNFPDGFQTLCRNCNWIKEYERKATVTLAALDEAIKKTEAVPGYNPRAKYARLARRAVGHYDI